MFILFVFFLISHTKPIMFITKTNNKSISYMPIYSDQWKFRVNIKFLWPLKQSTKSTSCKGTKWIKYWWPIFTENITRLLLHKQKKCTIMHIISHLNTKVKTLCAWIVVITQFFWFPVCRLPFCSKEQTSYTFRSLPFPMATQFCHLTRSLAADTPFIGLDSSMICISVRH